ncbi:MAG TPA: DUF4158 domain-containing protein [Pseudonocardiaceae bacterium]
MVADDGAVVVGTRDVFSEQELARLRGFPEITRAELIRYFTLASSDEGFLRKFTGQRNVLGAGVQLCWLPWLGFVPDEVGAAPEEAVARLANRLGISAGELAGYECGHLIWPRLVRFSSSDLAPPSRVLTVGDSVSSSDLAPPLGV